MKMAYQLDNTLEAQRLEIQSENKNYSLEEEFRIADIQIDPNDKILDAGCGTGLLSRFLVNRYRKDSFIIDAIDITDRLLEYAENASIEDKIYQERIKYSKLSITDLVEEEKYDKIFSRFVFQHIPSKQLAIQAAKKLWNSLTPGGKLCIIDCYGFFSHIDCENSWLTEQISFLEKKIPIDMNIGIKLRGILIDAGAPIESIKVRTIPFHFETPEEREAEAVLWKQRFENVLPLLNDALGELQAKRFTTEYIKEFLNPRAYTFAQKFIITATKI